MKCNYHNASFPCSAPGAWGRQLSPTVVQRKPSLMLQWMDGACGQEMGIFLKVGIKYPASFGELGHREDRKELVTPLVSKLRSSGESRDLSWVTQMA